jgi:predicted alpha/beta-fold hydrolase
VDILSVPFPNHSFIESDPNFSLLILIKVVYTICMSYILSGLLAAFVLTIVVGYTLQVKELSLTAWFGRIIGFGSVTLISAPQTILLDRKSTSAKQDDSLTNQISLRSLVEKITIPVKLNPFLFNGHVQTISVASGWSGPDCHIHYKRKSWQSDSQFYPGQFTIDFAIPPPAKPFLRDRTLPPRTNNFEENEWADFVNDYIERPLVIVLHGFLGGSHEKYIRHSLELLIAKEEKADFSVAVINARGCAYSKLTSPIMYHPQATWDLRQFVQWARREWPHRRLFAIGFSIGANVLCNYLGEEAETCELEAAVLIGNPWNLDVTNTLMVNSTMGLHVYQRSLGTAFRKMFER